MAPANREWSVVQTRLFDSCSVDALRKEVRKKRRFEAIHGKEWVPVTAADRMPYRDEDFEMSDGRSFNKDGRGRGGRGARGESLIYDTILLLFPFT